MSIAKLKNKLRAYFCHSKTGLWTAIAIALVTAITVSQKSHSAQWEGIDVEIRGTGPAIIFIPGLNSGRETFTQTCNSLAASYTCHLLHLPGFAGQAPSEAAQTEFLLSMRNAISGYLDHKNISRPIFVGHSLGGVLALMLASEDPQRLSSLIIIDALPFYPAINNPAATADSLRPQAEQMRAHMRSLPQEVYLANAAMQLAGMSNQPNRLPLLTEWSKASDRSTTTQAIYDMMTTDLRQELSKISAPTLVLGAWAAYQSFGATPDTTRAIFTQQYAKLKTAEIHLSEKGFHFLTWDDPEWVDQNIAAFLHTHIKATH